MKINKILPILFFTLLPTLLIWLPFFLKVDKFWGIPLPTNGMETIVANYDGPLYVVVAKTFYNPDMIKGFYSFNLPVEYYAAHFPLYPALIKLLAIGIVYPYAMLIVTVLSSFFCLYYFYKFISEYVASANEALFLTFAFSIFPARFLIVRSVGSPEPLFVGAIIASIYYFRKKKYLLAGIFGAVAQMTKSPAILLFIAYFLSLGMPGLRRMIISSNLIKTVRRLNFRFLFVFAIPLALAAVFLIFKASLNDFWAYFHSGDNIHLFFPPFEIFNYSQPWVNTHWLEEIIFVYMFGVLGVMELYKEKDRTIFWFVAIFFTSTIFVSHRDLIRYSLPIVPFLYAAFAKYLVKREFKIAFLFLVIPIYLFSLVFIANNVMPVANWSGLL